MAPRSVPSPRHSEFNDFLFAIIGEEKSGIQLTVLTALARLGLDPWAEAARLSDMTNEEAKIALAAAIGTFPEGDWKAADLPSIAGRLVKRLPEYGFSSAMSSGCENVGDRKWNSEARKWSIWIIVIGMVLYAVSRWYWG